jgi:hypothetical protein
MRQKQSLLLLLSFMVDQNGRTKSSSSHLLHDFILIHPGLHVFPFLSYSLQMGTTIPWCSSFNLLPSASRSWANLLLWGKVGTHLLISCILSFFRSFCRCPAPLDSWSWVAISLQHPADLSQGSHIWQAKISTLVTLSHELGSTQWCHA